MRHAVVGEQARGETRAVAPLADRRDGAVAGELAGALRDVADGNIDRAVDVTALELVRRPDVDDAQAVAIPGPDGRAQFGRRYPFDFRDRQPGADPGVEAAGNDSFDAIEADAKQLQRRFGGVRGFL